MLKECVWVYALNALDITPVILEGNAFLDTHLFTLKPERKPMITGYPTPYLYEELKRPAKHPRQFRGDLPRNQLYHLDHTAHVQTGTERGHKVHLDQVHGRLPEGRLGRIVRLNQTEAQGRVG